LAKIIPFRSDNLQKTVEGFADDLPPFQKIAGYLPSLFLKAGPMKSLAQTPNGPLYWHKHHMRERLYAFFGEEDPFSQSRDWDSYKNTPASQTPIVLNHGYDESKAEIDLTLSDLVEAAKFRGGTCLATDFGDRDMYRQVSWECAFGHRFSASPKLVLKAGHFCPQCDPLPWNYDRISQKNPFLAQVHKGEKVPHPAYEKEDVHDVFKKAGS
jgi:hypothetical protein